MFFSRFSLLSTSKKNIYINHIKKKRKKQYIVTFVYKKEKNLNRNTKEQICKKALAYLLFLGVVLQVTNFDAEDTEIVDQVTPSNHSSGGELYW